MKKNLVFIILMVLFIWSCEVQNTTMTITVDKSLEKEVRLFSREDGTELKIQPGEQKEIIIPVIGETTKKYYLAGNLITLKLKESDHITINVFGNELPNLKISGGSFLKENEYYLYLTNHLHYSWNKTQSLEKSEIFNTKMASLIKHTNDKIDDLLDQKSVDSDWALSEKMKIKYYTYARKLNYPFMNASFSFRKKPDSLPKFTKDILAKEVLNTDEMAKYGDGFLSTLIYHLGAYKSDAFGNYSNPKSLSALKFVQDSITNKKVKSIVSQNLMDLQLREYAVANIEPIQTYFEDHCKDKKVKETVFTKLAEMTGLGPGATAPEIELITMNGEVKHLSDFKGKNVYIDVWATYCGKCIAEMPNFRILENEYKDKNWVFISVSLDVNVEKWKKKATELGHLEQQYIVEKGHESKFNEDYKIGIAPRYIIIDKEGKIVNFNAPMPSNKKTRQIMDKV